MGMIRIAVWWDSDPARRSMSIDVDGGADGVDVEVDFGGVSERSEVREYVESLRRALVRLCREGVRIEVDWREPE